MAPDEPCRSPAAGIGWPLWEIRASIVTRPALERLRPGSIDWESSSVNFNGQMPTLPRNTATGGPGESTDLATMNSVAPAARFGAQSGGERDLAADRVAGAGGGHAGACPRLAARPRPGRPPPPRCPAARAAADARGLCPHRPGGPETQMTSRAIPSRRRCRRLWRGAPPATRWRRSWILHWPALRHSRCPLNRAAYRRSPRCSTIISASRNPLAAPGDAEAGPRGLRVPEPAVQADEQRACMTAGADARLPGDPWQRGEARNGAQPRQQQHEARPA